MLNWTIFVSFIFFVILEFIYIFYFFSSSLYFYEKLSQNLKLQELSEYKIPQSLAYPSQLL